MDAVRSELGAGLRPSNIDVCEREQGAAEEALALLGVELTNAEQERYRLDVTDAVTRKRVSRELSLSALPPDGRALALAVAAEELLRASWAELALRGPHSAGTEAPPEVRAVMDRAEPPPPAPSPTRPSALGARLGFEHFGGGQSQLGGDVFAALPLGGAWGVVAALGARRSLSVDAPHGSIEGTGWGAELGLSAALWRRGGLDVAAFAGSRLLRLTLTPKAAEGVASQSQSGFAVSARAGLAFALGKPGVFRSYTALGAGHALRAFSAADTGEVVTGASGFELLASTGLAWELP